MKWLRRRVRDNDGKLLDVWVSDDFELCRNINHGNAGPRGARGGWWYEILLNGRDIGEAPSRAAAIAVAEDAADGEAADDHR
jgi:hypothetical protein